MTLTFITGNDHKARQLSEYLQYPLAHTKIDLDEIQSLHLKDIIHHKVRRAYSILNTPVLVEDVSLEFSALGRLPGTFVKWFLHELGDVGLCNLLREHDNRQATARCMFGYYDGVHEKLFEGVLVGAIALAPCGNHGYGWDTIFIPTDYTQTRAEMDPDIYAETYEQLRPIHALRAYLTEVGS